MVKRKADAFASEIVVSDLCSAVASLDDPEKRITHPKSVIAPTFARDSLPDSVSAEANGPRGSEGLAILPSVRELDAGQKFVCTLVKEKFVTGWLKEWTVGPMLNLTYVARHGTRIDPESELGGTGHALLARRFVDSEFDKTEAFTLAHLDPIKRWVNGSRVHEGLQHFDGFEAARVSIPLRKGRNEIAVKLTNYFNRNFNRAGFLLRAVTAPTFKWAYAVALPRCGVGKVERRRHL